MVPEDSPVETGLSALEWWTHVHETHCQNGQWFQTDQIIFAVKLLYFFLHRRLISEIKSALSLNDFEQLTHAFIFSWSDYSNALVSTDPGFSFTSTVGQNVCACLLTTTYKRNHMNLFVPSLHTFPFNFRIHSSRILLYSVLTTLTALTLKYISELLWPCSFS